MEDTEQLKARRKVLRAKVTLKVGDVDLGTLGTDEATKNEIMTLIRDWKNSEHDLLELDFDEEKFESYTQKCKVLMNYFVPAPSTTTTTVTTGHSNTIKYQKRSLPVFEGDMLRFNLFFREFERMIDNDETLSLDEKFFALKSMLKGEPLRLVANLVENAVNYQRAKEILKEKYQDEKRIAILLVEKVKSLPVINENDINELEKTVDEIKCLYREAVDHKLDSYIMENIIRPAFLSKWYSQLAAQSGTTCEKLVEFFSQAAKECIRNREILEVNRVNVSTYNNCAFCGQNHKSISCNANMTNIDRKDIVFKKKLCFVCLQGNHRAGQCKSKYVCKKCGKRHSFLICTENIVATGSITAPGNVAVQTVPKNLYGDPTA